MAANITLEAIAGVRDEESPLSLTLISTSFSSRISVSSFSNNFDFLAISSLMLVDCSLDCNGKKLVAIPADGENAIAWSGYRHSTTKREMAGVAKIFIVV